MDASQTIFWKDAILAGGFNKTVTLAGSEPPNRVVIPSIRQHGRTQGMAPRGRSRLMEQRRQRVRRFSRYAVEGVAQWAALPTYRIAEFMSSFSRLGKVN
jgi:hypothetical protein